MKPIARFLLAATDARHFPPVGPPEFAFLGRSNVGKSSLINSLLQQKLAHVSSAPGRTRSINFIGIYSKPDHPGSPTRPASAWWGGSQPDPALTLVDLPGYGYAKISREISAEWPKFIEPYLKDRETLALAIVLIDANVPPQESDRQLIRFLQSIGREFLVVATKSDKLSGNKLRNALVSLAREHGISNLLPYSVKTGAGRNELWREITNRVRTG